MSQQLINFYISTLHLQVLTSEELSRYVARVKQGKLTREEDPISHTCAMILAFDAESKKILVVHHKEAKMWLFPGGHSDVGENPPQAALREAEEELGLHAEHIRLIGPFGAQILDIDNPPQICREHYDIFYAIATSPSEITVDMKEFHEYEWLTVEEAYKKITLKYYQDALEKFVRFMKW